MKGNERQHIPFFHSIDICNSLSFVPIGNSAKEYRVKKKTKWGNAILNFFEKSDTTLVHLECYPVYLHLPHCLGSKVVDSVLVKCTDLLQGLNSSFITDLLLQFYVGGCLSSRDIQKIVDNLLEDEEARTRRTAIRLIWRLTLLSRTNSAIFLPFAYTRADTDPGKEKTREKKDRRKSSGSNDLLAFSRVIPLVCAKLKDRHALVQSEAASIIKELAQISVSAFPLKQKSFLFKQLLCDGKLAGVQFFLNLFSYFFLIII